MISALPVWVLSADGRFVATERATGIVIFDVYRSRGTWSALGHEPSLVALSPHGRYALAAGEDRLSILDSTASWGVVHQLTLPASLFRAAMGDGGMTVGVVASQDGGDSTLLAWRPDGSPALDPGVALGDSTPFGLALDEQRKRILLWGASGPGSIHGVGDRFVRLVSVAGDSHLVVWAGPSPIGELVEYVMPLAFGDIGVYDRDRLVRISPDTHPEDIASIVDSYPLGNLENLVTSPDGRLVAWRWSESGVAPTERLRVVRLADGTVLDRAEYEEVGVFPSIAVDNNGVVTLVATQRPNRLVVRRLSAGELATVFDISWDAAM
jgi:hypothetical protein